MAARKVSARRLSTSRAAKKILRDRKRGKKKQGDSADDARPTGRQGSLGGVIILVVVVLVVVSFVLAQILG